MFSQEDKENVLPELSAEAPGAIQYELRSPKKSIRKGRSKSIGPGGLEDANGNAIDGHTVPGTNKNRRKSTYVPATKPILSADSEKAERQAARRKTLANRRVSFAPEATLHTWDVIEFMRDPTTSTESPGSTRRGSHVGGSLSPSRGPGAEADASSTSPRQNDESADLSESLAEASVSKKKYRRSSGIPPMNFNNLDEFSSSDVGESSDGDQEGADSDEDSGNDTAMSIDTADNTVQSLAESSSSTDSSAKLEAALRQAAHVAGTRGIEYDEHGDDVSMEIASDEITNAFKPWAKQQGAHQPTYEATADQENVNPFSSVYNAKSASDAAAKSTNSDDDDTENMSMDVTRAVGGILRSGFPSDNSPAGDQTMEFTQAVGKINENQQLVPSPNHSSQKRRRSTTEFGSPTGTANAASKRRRSSAARRSMEDESMDLTMAMGSIQNLNSTRKQGGQSTTSSRYSLGEESDQGDATMEFTRAVGVVKRTSKSDITRSSLDENEELTMELTTAVGGVNNNIIQPLDHGQPRTPPTVNPPSTPKLSTTPKNHEPIRNDPPSEPITLATPTTARAAATLVPKSPSPKKLQQSASPKPTPETQVHDDFARNNSELPDATRTTTPLSSPRRIAPTSSTPPSVGAVKRRSSSKRNSRSSEGTIKNAKLDMPRIEQSETDQRSLQAPQVRGEEQKQSPSKSLSTPDRRTEEPTLTLADSIKLMSTPRKEVLKSVTPKKQSVKPAKFLSPPKKTSPSIVTSPGTQSPGRDQLQNIGELSVNAENVINMVGQPQQPIENIRLQEFLDLAGIRFLDLTTTKRRLTTAPTPSKTRRIEQEQNEQEIDLESAVVAGSSTHPELEMYEHACHELRRYISDGKKVIKELETQTAKDNPPLIRAYMASGSDTQTAIDAQMRDIKTHARLRSKEMWYAWRSQLLDDLMKALQSIGEGLIRDDEIVQHLEELVEQVVPMLLDRHQDLANEAHMLEQENATADADDKKELESARAQLQLVSEEVKEKQALLEELQNEAITLDTQLESLGEGRAELTAVVKEADRVKAACRGVSLDELNTLKESIHKIETTTGWTIRSASCSGAVPAVTMVYCSELQLTFSPPVFRSSSSDDSVALPEAPIDLVHLPSKSPSTAERFCLQLLQTRLQALPYSRTSVKNLLRYVSQVWDTAQAVDEAERRLRIETRTESYITSNQELTISSTILLPITRSKVRVAFNVAMESSEKLEFSTTVVPCVANVYGQSYNERMMTNTVQQVVQSSFDGWDVAVRDLQERLIKGSFLVR